MVPKTVVFESANSMFCFHLALGTVGVFMPKVCSWPTGYAGDCRAWPGACVLEGLPKRNQYS